MTGQYASMTPFERNMAVGHGMTSLHITRRIVAGLESMFRRAGTSTQGNIYAIVGPTHVGKSTAQKIFMIQKAQQLGGFVENVKPGENDFPEVADVSYVTVQDANGRLKHPVMRIEIHENPTVKALGTHVARALARDEDPPRFSNLNEMTAFFTRQLRGKGVKLVIFDDVQEIGRVTGAARNQAVVLFKALCKTGHTEVAAAGIEGTLEVLSSDKQTADLTTKRHIFEPLPCPPWDDENADVSQSAFVTFMREMKAHLPFDRESAIDERDIAEPMWHYSQGVIGVAKTLLQEATDYAIHRNLPAIDRKVLRDVVTYEMDLADHHNPFNDEVGGGGRRLS
ncbi:TniB family NTP-binding protein [Pelagibacterium mangrovi]|uniref:TniB family NTP-binding protein n=1 Tax=Pelagibacterium mangrovi TaxID=3119828 RepID=UPI002FCC0CFC